MRSGSSVKRVAVVTHDHEPAVVDAVSRLERVARSQGIELAAEDGGPDLAVTLGGDGSMLRAFHRFLGTGVPVIGVNFGRVGFLTSIRAEEMEEGLARAFRGDFTVVELPTLEVRLGAESWPAVNDVFATSSTLGRMVELAYAVGGEDLGVLPCDGLICSTPSGSTAYNLSNGGPVLVWGLDAIAITFVAPHSLHVRPLVVPRNRDLAVTNQTTSRGSVTVIIDGQEVGKLEYGERVEVRLAEQSSLLATLPESTFFTRYRETFAS
ncbi:MAG TPA: NAD(+)/NADH kinase [Gaiellaceae bacterium]|nr:NAD(+)/NADH kinase [Gaiellaceae bacterium]